MTKEDLQKKIIQFQYMEASLKTLQERAQFIAQRMEELQRTMLAMEDLSNTKPNNSYIPLGSGIFVQGNIEKTDDLIVNIGAGVVMKKKKEEAKKMLEEKITLYEEDLKKISNNAQTILVELQKIQQDIQKMQG